MEFDDGRSREGAEHGGLKAGGPWTASGHSGCEIGIQYLLHQEHISMGLSEPDGAEGGGSDGRGCSWRGHSGGRTRGGEDLAPERLNPEQGGGADHAVAGGGGSARTHNAGRGLKGPHGPFG